MSLFGRKLIVIGAFLLVAFLGIALSLSAPYSRSNDELVYLTGALQVQEQTLPDAEMLAGYDYSWYLYPQILHAWYEDLGHDGFKSVFLITLVLVTGLAAYSAFRLLWLPWIPALLLSIVSIIPRYTAGTEIFGVFTFRDAIGRACALPLFFLGTAWLIRRLIEKKSIWPIYGVFGLFMFLHPATVMIFAFVTLFVSGIILIFVVGEPLLKVIKKIIGAGLVFILTGSYFLVDVINRLLQSAEVQGETVITSEFIQAIAFRNTWEFPEESLNWYRHTAVVSLFFILLLLAFYRHPKLKEIRTKYVIPNAKIIFSWGSLLMITSLVFAIIIPGTNLYFMEHHNAPYIFQQWVRVAKFFYLGLFVALLPLTYALWHWYKASSWRFKNLALALLFVTSVASSSIGFEFAQFIIGYPNYERAYVPQFLSGAPDGITDSDYKEVCAALNDLGASDIPKVISSDFAFRYYCRADLYVTNEEGGAYNQLPRNEMVAWHKRYLEQRAMYSSLDIDKMLEFADSHEADFVIFPRAERNLEIENSTEHEIVVTSRHFIVKVEK